MDEDFLAPDATLKRELRSLSKRSDLAGVFQLSTHLVLLMLTGAVVLAAGESAWSWLAMAVHGAVLVFLFAPLHECVHRTAFRSRSLNDAVARVCGAVVFLPPDYFRNFHFAHHRHTQDPDRDPELATPKPVRLREYFWRVSGLPYWRDRITTLPRHALGRVTEAFIAPGQRNVVIREARMMLVFYALLVFGSVLLQSDLLLRLWWIPVLMGQPLLRLYLLAEHTGCPYVPNMLENTRTTRTLAAVRRLAWNMPYHVEHHACPAVPFHALPRAHGLLKDRIEFLADGYLSVHRGLLSELRTGSVPALGRSAARRG